MQQQTRPTDARTTVPAPTRSGEGTPSVPHLVEVGHTGMFAHATCTVCGWRGPGRRALSRAHDDGAAHRLLA